MSIKTLLEVEIGDEFNELSEMKKGSETYKVTVDGLVKLLDRAIEIEKFYTERTEKAENQKIELNKFDNDLALRERQMEEEKKDRFVKNAVAIAGIALPVAVAIWGTIYSLNYEERDQKIISNFASRTHLGKLFSKK